MQAILFHGLNMTNSNEQNHLSENEIDNSLSNATIRKPLRYIIEVDENGGVAFDFEHDEIQNPGHSAYKMARLLVMMQEGEMHHVIVDGIRNRSIQGDAIASLILEHYGSMYVAEGPCIGPKEVFSMKKARNA